MTPKTPQWRNVNISTRVVLTGLLIITLFVAFTYGWLLPEIERTLIEKKKEKIKEATESAWSILAHYHRLSLENKLSVEHAKQASRDLIREMRFGPKMNDYFWINDMSPTLICHPYRRDLEGKDVSDYKDPKGLRLFLEFAKIARKKGDGFVSYYWQRPDDSKKIVPKISYIRLFRPWGWIVGTGMYIEDIRSEIRTWKIRAFLVSILVTLIGVYLSWRMGRWVSELFRKETDPHIIQEDDAAGPAVLRLQSFLLLVVVPPIVVLTVLWAGQLYGFLNTAIIEGFDRKLAAISRVTGGFIKGEDHQSIEETGDENSILYRKYVEPMRRVMAATGLTYLYTQVLSDTPPKCRYIIDATQGEEHSAIGFEDSLPIADYRGAEKVILYGTVFIGRIQSTANWGLLKSAFAPIYDADQNIHAMAGADVNVTVINEKTRLSLFAVASLGVAALLLAAYASYFFAKRLTLPLNRLKDYALSIASGQHNSLFEHADAPDLKQLSDAFRKTGVSMKRLAEKYVREDQRTEQEKLEQDLMSAMTHHLMPNGPFLKQPGYIAAAVPFHQMPSGAGMVGDPERCIIFRIADDLDPAVEKQILLSNLHLISRAILKQSPDVAAEMVRPLFDAGSEGLEEMWAYNSRKNEIVLLSQESATVTLVSEDGVVCERPLSRNDAVKLSRTRLVVLGGPVPPKLIDREGKPVDLSETTASDFSEMVTDESENRNTHPKDHDVKTGVVLFLCDKERSGC